MREFPLCLGGSFSIPFASLNNTHSRVVVIAPVTSNVRRASPSHIIVSAGTAGLGIDSRVLTDQVRAIDRRRLVQRIGQLPAGVRNQVKQALRATFDL